MDLRVLNLEKKSTKNICLFLSFLFLSKLQSLEYLNFLNDLFYR